MKKEEKLYTFLYENNATCLGNHRNDLGQMIEFYEHPIFGDGADILAVFPDEKVAFGTGMYDLEDMTMTYHSIGMFLDKKDEDSDYVPRLVDGEMLLKYEL